MRRAQLLLAVVAIAIFAAAAWAQDNGNSKHWTGAMHAGQTLTVKNISGDITVEPASGETAEINAEKSGRDADQVQISIISNEEGVEVCTIYPGEGNTCDHSHSDNVRARVDYTIKIPRDVKLRAANVNGEVTAENLGAEADVSSVNGSVRVSTATWAEAESVNGSVHAKLGRADWPSQAEFKSVNGNVDVTVPADLNADVRFSTLNGNIHSDFNYTVASGTRIGGHPGTKVDATIGSGGRGLRLESVNGDLDLRKE